MVMNQDLKELELRLYLTGDSVFVKYHAVLWRNENLLLNAHVS